MESKVLSVGGRAEIAGVVVPPYPEMLHLTELEEPMVAQIKVNGFNVRVFSIGKEWTCVLRGGAFDKNTYGLLKEHFDKVFVDFFKDQPKKVLCIEIIGKKTIANYKGDKDIDFFVFDIMDLEKPEDERFLPSEKVSELCKKYGFQMVETVGTFDKKENLEKEMLKINPIFEGVVLKSTDGKTIMKYKFEDNPELFKEKIHERPKKVHIEKPESRIVGHFFQGYCYDKQTEMLTEEGFKYFSELTEKDKVAQLNNGMLEFVKPRRIIKQNYNGKMIKIKSRAVNLLVTPNHNFYFRCANYHKEKNLKFRLGKINLGKDTAIHFLSTCKWVGKKRDNFLLPPVKILAGGKFHKKGYTNSIRIKMNDWLEFLGYFISEGCATTSYRVIIDQQEGEKKEKIKNVLKRLPFRFSEVERRFVICNKQLHNYLKLVGENAKGKRIPKEFKALVPQQLKILYNALMLGDGNVCRNGKQETYYTSSRRLADDVAEIILKMGYSFSISVKKPKETYYKNKLIKSGKMYEIYKNFSEYRVLIPSRHFSKTNYKGMVYCVQVPSNIILVRRNNRVVWCGNSEKELGLESGMTPEDLKKYEELVENLRNIEKSQLGANVQPIVKWLMETINKHGKFSQEMQEKIEKEFKSNLGKKISKFAKR